MVFASMYYWGTIMAVRFPPSSYTVSIYLFPSTFFPLNLRNPYDRSTPRSEVDFFCYSGEPHAASASVKPPPWVEAITLGLGILTVAGTDGKKEHSKAVLGTHR